MRKFLACTSLVFAACISLAVASKCIAQEQAPELTSEIVLISEVEWGPLNAARGDKGPKAGTLWGDRTSSGPSGFLVKFVDGFSSPPHIHNITYRGVVISGLIHNDDPKAEKMWMPSGSFWTQPAGEGHITAAKGRNNLTYIEIEEGPYLVLPTEEAFDNGERPVNVEQLNLIWLDATNTTWIEQFGMPLSAKGPKITFLWGNPQDDQLNGTLVKLPTGFTGKIRSHGSTFRAVVIQGQPNYKLPNDNIKTLEPGSYFSSKGKSVHYISSETGGESILYVRMEGKFDIISAKPKK